ncbi:translation initiation factor eIF 4e-like domain-containing protein [Naematelia encephala]|uniref:Eukaryotic translation initiation factor 4E n=1 Tax=Naematelia encephala TaxID=71784 RepID=A0A1Y2B0E7_9TREE|nr:translation initiation factor eIF 4e-like domain-containing protein [Naematelia encephala]
MTSTLPPAAAKAVEHTLSEALAAASISSSSPSSEPKELPNAADTTLEEGEIREEGDDEKGTEEEEEEEDDGRVKTVFDDANRFNVKHPLYSQWTLYFDSPQSKLLPKTPSSTPATPQVAHGGWMDDIRKVVSFDSVEEFWGLYNNIVPPSQLPGKANYYLFKDGIMPAWEDPANKNGGKWAIQLPREKSKAAIDKMWLYTMLAAIGETFETPLPSKDGKETPVPLESDLVTGVIVSSRPNFYRIAIWTRDAPDTSLTEADPLVRRIMTIGRHFKTSALGYDPEQKIVSSGLATDIAFESHRDSEKKGNKNRLTV